MPKVTLDRETFKVLASDTRLDILRALDGKSLGLNDIAKVTSLNKATLHEHLSKLTEAGLVKRKEREGHKWVFYKLSWKGENLLHPENTRIVVLFSVTFIAFCAGIYQLFLYFSGRFISAADEKLYAPFEGGMLNENVTSGGEDVVANGSQILRDGFENGAFGFYQDPLFLYIALICFVICSVLFCVSLWRYRKNKKPQL